MPAEDKHNLDTVMYKFGEHYGRGEMRNTVTNLGWVRGQDHTNNEQTQSAEGII